MGAGTTGSRGAGRGCAWWARSTTRRENCSPERTSSTRNALPPISACCTRSRPRAGCRGASTWTSTARSSATMTTGPWRRSCAVARIRRRWAGGAGGPRDRLYPGLDLDRVCSFRYEATVLNDNTVRLGGTIVLDIPPRPRGRSWAGTRVEVRQLLDGTWRVYSGDRLVTTGAATTHGELRALLHRRKRGRGAPTTPPMHASFAEARP